MSTSGASPLITRRNGKLQACEPCRLRKVACDHGYPVCSRCRRRPNPEKTCYYASPHQVTRSGERTSSFHSTCERTFSDSRFTKSSPLSSGNVALDDRIWSSPAARPPTGFLGPTSFTAAYLETENHLAVKGPLVSTEATRPSPTSLASPSLAEIHDMAHLDQGANHLTIKVLQAIPTEKPDATIFRPHINTNDEWMRLIGEKLIKSIWESFGSYLHDRRNTEKLQELGSIICINTRRRLKEDQADPLAWMDSFSGQNMRWEAVGMIFINAAFRELSASISAESVKRISYYTEYCSSCINLANMGGSSSSLMLFLLHKRSVLHACMHGETSLPYWKFHAETVAMLTFSGFHDDGSKDSLTTLPGPTVSMEARRRVGCQIFIVDKFLATFVGRPPLLARRYCTIKLPLDLADATLLSDKETFQRQLHRIDPDGWDIDCQFHSSSLLRARMMVALIRDEILEVWLGHGDNSPIDTIIDLQNKEAELYKRLPTYVLCPAFEEIKVADFRAVYPKLLIRLDHLLNNFLLDRLLVKEGHCRGGLLRTSFEMLVLTLHCWTQKHIWAEIQEECIWLIMGYAAPAGAILCMELMDPSPVDIAVDEDLIAGEAYSKSSIIQYLSLLVGCLNSWGSSQPNSNTASKIRGVIKIVLDRTINHTNSSQMPEELESFNFTPNWDDISQFYALDNANWFAEDGDIGQVFGI